MRRTNKASRVTAFTSGGTATVKIINTKAGVPLQLQGAGHVPPMVVSSGTKGQHLNADMLDGVSSVVLAPRASTALTMDGPDGAAANTEVLSTTIIAPEAGLLPINAKMEMERTTAGVDNVGCMFRVNGGNVLGSAMWVELVGTDGYQEDNWVNSGFHYVSGSGTYTVSFLFWSVSDGTNLKEGTLWALYVPVDGSTGQFFGTGYQG